MADATFVSRRDTSFREFPPASAQLAVVLPFFGDLAIWIRKAGTGGWQLPASTRRSGETILEVAKRELWSSTRVVTGRLDLLGAVRREPPAPSTAYVYMCDASNLPWAFEMPEGIEEIALFGQLPRNLASSWSETVLRYALHARRLGLR
jgi:ADP-ribose pyrophosphatase YjhB (NUDIX family)